jgi:hypothetical protein
MKTRRITLVVEVPVAASIYGGDLLQALVRGIRSIAETQGDAAPRYVVELAEEKIVD